MIQSVVLSRESWVGRVEIGSKVYHEIKSLYVPGSLWPGVFGLNLESWPGWCGSHHTLPKENKFVASGYSRLTTHHSILSMDYQSVFFFRGRKQAKYKCQALWVASAKTLLASPERATRAAPLCQRNPRIRDWYWNPDPSTIPQSKACRLSLLMSVNVLNWSPSRLMEAPAKYPRYNPPSIWIRLKGMYLAVTGRFR